MDNVLVIQMARMGDFMQSTPLLCGIKRAHPGCTLHVLIDKKLFDLAGTCPFVDRRYGLDTRLLSEAVAHGEALENAYGLVRAECRELRALSIDAVYNLNYSPLAVALSCVPQSPHVFGYAAGSNRRGMQKSPWFCFFNALVRHARLAPFNLVDFFYYLGGRPEHRPQQLCYRLTRQANDATEALLTEKGISGDKDLLVALQLGTRHMQRQWPVEYFTRVAEGLLARNDTRLLLLGAAEDAALGKTFLDMTSEWETHKKRRITNLIGATTLEQLAGVLHRSRLLLSADTGTMHLAAAAGTSIVGLFFGPAYAHFTGPYGPGHWIFQATNDCSPCIEDRPTCSDYHCRHAVGPRHVLALVEHLLFQAPLAGASAGDAVLLRSRFDRWGIVYEPVFGNQTTLQKLQRFCYREMGKAVLDGQHDCGSADVPERGYTAPERPEELSDENISRTLRQARELAQLIHAHPDATLPFRGDDQYGFWHPWIDFYDDLRRHGAAAAGDAPAGQAQSFFASGLAVACRTLKGLLTH